MKEHLKDIGINLSYLTAGFLGGVVKAFLAGDARPWTILAFIIVGAITANYVTELISTTTGVPTGATGFFVGVTATIVCDKMASIAERLDAFQKTKGDK